MVLYSIYLEVVVAELGNGGFILYTRSNKPYLWRTKSKKHQQQRNPQVPPRLLALSYTPHWCIRAKVTQVPEQTHPRTRGLPLTLCGKRLGSLKRLERKDLGTPSLTPKPNIMLQTQVTYLIADPTSHQFIHIPILYSCTYSQRQALSRAQPRFNSLHSKLPSPHSQPTNKTTRPPTITKAEPHPIIQR